jgi:O-antigen/teichoic acid export membrane protein
VSFQYVLIAVALIPGTIYQVYWNGIMIGTDHVFLLNKVNLTVNTINALLMIMAVGVLQMGIPGFLYAWIISSVSGLALTVFLAGRLQPWEWPRRESVARILGFGLRSHGQQVAHQLFLRFDVYAVKVLAGAAGVGFYSLSTSLAEKLWLPLNAIHASSLGRIAGMPRDDSALLTARVMRAAILIMASVAIPFGLISPWLIPFVYGAEFSASVLPLIILLVGTMGFAVMFVANSFIIGQLERPGLLSLVSWLQLVVSIPMYIALILWLGIIGAAIASSVTYLVAMSITLSIFKGASGLKLSAMLVPRRSDFSDYMRIVKPIKDKVGLWARRVRHTPQP